VRTSDLTKQQLAFLAGLLHDIGKLSGNFIKSKEPHSSVTDFHGQILWQDREFIPSQLRDFINQPWSESKEITIAKLVCSHHGCQRCLGPTGCQGLEDHPIKKNLQTYDRCDTSNPSDNGKQNSEHMEMTDFFGKTKIIDISTFDGKRIDLYIKLNNALEKSSSFKDLAAKWTFEIIKATKDAFCETRKHSTDLTLAAHLLSTAILFSLGINEKTILCTTIPIDLSISHGYVIGCDKENKAVLTCTLNRVFDEIIYDKFEPFDEFIWLEDALPNYKPGLQSIIEKCRTDWVKQPEDIEPGYTLNDLIGDIEKLKNLAKLSYAQEFEEKRRSWGRHLKNLKKAESLSKLSAEWIAYAASIEQSLAEVDELLVKTGSVNNLLEENAWKDCPEAHEWAWFFLSKTMSPIRPTSPVTWARRILDEDPYDSTESALKWILGRRLTLGRWLAIQLATITNDEELSKFVSVCLSNR
jgi:hypothetical protein